MEINNTYNIGDSVKIKPINTVGTVTAVFFGETGLQYQVAYFLNGERKHLYLYPVELSNITGTESLGFLTAR
jgi:hypothetical protein